MRFSLVALGREQTSAASKCQRARSVRLAPALTQATRLPRKLRYRPRGMGGIRQFEVVIPGCPRAVEKVKGA
jgi:hypothetical protein